MKIRNYTSEVPVERSISNIETLLVAAGASHIAKVYDDQKEISGFIFQLAVDLMPATFKLPVNAKAVLKIFEAEAPRTKSVVLWPQAKRTAWKLLHEWVHLQITMIQLGQAEAVQLFLPYAYDAKRDMTLFDKMKEGGFKQLGAGKEQP